MNKENWWYHILAIVFLLTAQGAAAQENENVNWISFEDLSDSLTANPTKKVLINFHTEWCAYCRKMMREVFTVPDIVSTINGEYYAVNFDAESTDTVRFDGQLFINKEHTRRRNGIHEIARILGSRGRQFTVPVTIVLNPDFTVKARYFEYLSPAKMRTALR